MPRYDYRCPKNHMTEAIFRMSEVPIQVCCASCSAEATRVYSPPAAIHFRGPGFYATDVHGKLHRKRRSNPGDDLPVEYDLPAAQIADSI